MPALHVAVLVISALLFVVFVVSLGVMTRYRRVAFVPEDDHRWTESLGWFTLNSAIALALLFPVAYLYLSPLMPDFVPYRDWLLVVPVLALIMSSVWLIMVWHQYHEGNKTTDVGLQTFTSPASPRNFGSTGPTQFVGSSDGSLSQFAPEYPAEVPLPFPAKQVGQKIA